VALVSDAGTPLVSDPGYRLVCAAASAGIAVAAVPGPSSLTAALSLSGLPTDAFVFLGFPPRKKERRMRQLMQLKQEDKTLAFFESPRRIVNLITDIAGIMGDRRAVLCRELTKRHEECLRGRLSDILAALTERSAVKGECTLLIAADDPEQAAGDDTVETEIRAWLRSNQRGTGAMAREISRRLGVSRSSVYEKAVRIRKEEKK
jgi:16S rRNA (cytidine1402-2'-O)-methyltransferase